jgi:hypothetical protein
MKGKITGNLMPSGFGLDYSPVNEQGVIFLFAKYHKALGIEALQTIHDRFPDAIGRIKVDKDRFAEVGIEFEYKSSGFKEHIKKKQYDGENCKFIVCWEHDWKECPKEIEVIELKTKLLELIETGKISKKLKGLTKKQEEYLKFYDDMLNRLKSKLPNVTNQKALPQSWCSIPIGISNIHLEWCIMGRSPNRKFSVDFHFERKNKEENEKLFEYFKNIKNDLERELGNLNFQYPWGEKWARIYLERSFNDKSEEEIEEIKKWGLEKMVKFYIVFQPHFQKLKEILTIK